MKAKDRSPKGSVERAAGAALVTSLGAAIASLVACNAIFGVDALEYTAPALPGGAGGGGGGTAAGGSGTTTSGTTGGHGGSAGATPQPALARRIQVAAAVDTPGAYSVAVVFDHAALVAAQKSRADGSDVRVLAAKGGQWVEVDRVIDPWSSWNSPTTTLWFATPSSLVSGETDESHALSYGSAGSEAPFDDADAVYIWFDDFEDGTLDPEWTVREIGTATESVTESDGVLHLAGTAGDLWNQADDIVLVHVSVVGDFVADCLVWGAEGLGNSWGKPGGVMVRQNELASSAHVSMLPIYEAVARQLMWRLVAGGTSAATNESGSSALPEAMRVQRIGNVFLGASSVDGDSWHLVGTITFSSSSPMLDPVLVGIPLANSTGGSADVEWFRVRSIVVPEPTVTLGPEVPLDSLPATTDR